MDTTRIIKPTLIAAAVAAAFLAGQRAHDVGVATAAAPAVAAAATVAIREAVEAPAVLLKVLTVPEAAFASVTRKAFRTSA